MHGANFFRIQLDALGERAQVVAAEAPLSVLHPFAATW
jgi:hypothetical protein